MDDVRNLVNVKPLQWGVASHPLCHDHWTAPAFCGAYHMAPDEDSAAGAWLLQWAVRPEDFCMVYGGEIRSYPLPEAAKAAAQADYEARILAALTPASGGRAEGLREAAAWKDDPAADERWNAGVDFAMSRLCEMLRVDPHGISWDAATETLEGDIMSVLGNILTAGLGEDWPDILARAAEREKADGN